jgi:hypothetical protein
MNETCALIKEGPRTNSLSFHHVCTQQDAGSRHLARGLWSEPIMLASALLTSSLQNFEKYLSVVYKLSSLWYFVIITRID